MYSTLYSTVYVHCTLYLILIAWWAWELVLCSTYYLYKGPLLYLPVPLYCQCTVDRLGVFQNFPRHRRGQCCCCWALSKQNNEMMSIMLGRHPRAQSIKRFVSIEPQSTFLSCHYVSSKSIDQLSINYLSNWSINANS